MPNIDDNNLNGATAIFPALVKATVDGRESEAANLTAVLAALTGESEELIKQLVQDEILDAENYDSNEGW